MTLYLDVRNLGVTLAALGPKGAAWLELPAGSSAGSVADAAIKRLKLGPNGASCVVVAAGGEKGKRDVSWSAVRAGVATANALAFAWNAPVASLPVDGDEPRDVLEAKARKACAGAKPGDGWASALYSGEPTITKAKKVL